jgi:conjugative transfer region protein TrbK
MTFAGTAVLSLVAIAVAGCTIPLRDARNELPPAGDPLDARLERCSTLGAMNVDDADCQSAFAEARKRLLPLPGGK